MDKKISIITVNLNNREGLEKTILSVIGQDCREIEFIIIDGGSTDGSVDVAEKYRHHVHILVSEKDSGIYDAMNKGISKASGNYLQFLNSGDILCENTVISAVLPYLGKADIVYGNMKIDSAGEISDGFMPDQITKQQMVRDTLWHPVSFIKRELFARFGMYDTTFRIAGDYEFFFRTIILHRCSTIHINRFIVVFNLAGLSSDIKNVSLVQAEKNRVLEAHLTREEINSLKFVEPPRQNMFQRIKGWFQ